MYKDRKNTYELQKFVTEIWNFLARIIIWVIKSWKNSRGNSECITLKPLIRGDFLKIILILFSRLGRRGNKEGIQVNTIRSKEIISWSDNQYKFDLGCYCILMIFIEREERRAGQRELSSNWQCYSTLGNAQPTELHQPRLIWFGFLKMDWVWIYGNEGQTFPGGERKVEYVIMKILSTIWQDISMAN